MFPKFLQVSGIIEFHRLFIEYGAERMEHIHSIQSRVQESTKTIVLGMGSRILHSMPLFSGGGRRMWTPQSPYGQEIDIERRAIENSTWPTIR
jgi:hypothetical protein